MKAMQRHSATAVGFLALSLAGIPAFAQQQQPAQRGGPPGENTPYILVTTFQSADRKLGVEVGDELRKRIQSEHTAKELYAVPRNSINSTLEASGYRPDSALNASDLMELSKQMHGEYVIDGKADKSGTGNGVRLSTRILLRTGTTTLAQPLPVADGKDVGDAVKMVEKSISDALKGMKPYKDCIQDLRTQKFDQADKDARLGIAAYSNSVLSRICLLQAQTGLKSPPDSIIATAKAILAVDSTSQLALVNLADAYKAKGDKDNAISTNLAIYRLDPSNVGVVTSLIDELANSGAADRALPLLEPLLKDNPSDAALLRKKWALLLVVASNTKGAGGTYKQAISAGEEMAKADTAAATLDYFNRQIGAAQSDSNAAKAQELASKAGQKYPKEITFQLLLAQTYTKQGQTQQALASARRALEIDPKHVGAAQYVLFGLNQLGQTDSIIPVAQKLIAAGVPKDSIAASMLATVGPALKKAQDTKERADWETVLKAAETVDGIAPSQQTAFYIGVSSFQIATDLLTHVQTITNNTKTPAKAAEKAQACVEVKQAEDMLVKTSIAMPRGGRENPAAAAQILTNTASFGEFITGVKKAYACK